MKPHLTFGSYNVETRMIILEIIIRNEKVIMELRAVMTLIRIN